MAKTASASPSLVPAILALIVILGVGYLLLNDSQPSRTEHTLSPPIELIEEIQEETFNTALPVSPDQQAILEEEATLFVDKLAESQDKQVIITEEGGEFVRHDGIISLPDYELRSTTLDQLLLDSTIAPDTKITLDFTEIQIEQTTLSTIDEHTNDKMTILQIETESGQLFEAPLVDLLKHPDLSADSPIKLITNHKRTETTTKSELADLNISPSQALTATINKSTLEFAVNEIIDSEDEYDDNAMFYLHRVTENDRQGLWGIIQSGLIQRFREGLTLEGITTNKESLSVTIPADADEPLPTGLSSFLGKVLKNKVETSYVFNYTTKTMGRNPDLIYPGQQLIMIHFSPEELEKIYLFFAEQRRQNAQSFGINN